jgi:hypothetical protein
MLLFYRKEKDPNLDGQYVKLYAFSLVGLLISNLQYHLDYIIQNVPITNTFLLSKQMH